MRVWVCTRPATIRVRNQDRAVVGRSVLDETVEVERHDLEPPVLLGVFDGLGGHPAGDVASELAARVVADADLPADADEATTLLHRANRALHEAARREPHLTGMGTTAVLAVVSGDDALVANVGDSTAWHLTGDRLVQMSVTDRGALGGLLQCLGGFDPEEVIVPHTSEVALAAGDRLLLASDGLTDVVPAEWIRATLRHDLDEAAARLVAAVEQAGVPDDLTLLLVGVGPDAGGPPLGTPPEQP